MYYNRDTHFMVNQSVNDFFTRFLFKTYALPHNVALPLDIAATFFNNSSTNIREFLISKGVQVPPRPRTENNHQGNQRLLLVRNAALEAEKKIRTIKAAVKPESGISCPKTLTGMLAGNPSTKMVGLVYTTLFRSVVSYGTFHNLRRSSDLS